MYVCICKKLNNQRSNMMTQLQAKMIVFFLIAAMAAGCTSGTKKIEDNNITFDSISIDKSYHLLENDSNPNCNLQIKFVFPVKYANADILKKIQSIFTEQYFGENYGMLTPQNAVEKYTEEYINMYKDLEVDYKAEVERAKADNTQVGSWFSYYETSANNIPFNQNDILCFSVNFENYTGGAHGAHAQNNHVINLKTGSLVTEEEVFIEDYQDALSKILIEKIAKQNNVENPKELENVGFFSVDEIYPNGNFLVDTSGITYTFNEYEIAAYVVGKTNVFIPYEEIQLLLRKESPISQLINN